MSFTLKQIDGAVVEKKPAEYPDTDGWDNRGDIADAYCTYGEEYGYNEGADAQSSVKLRFNRENLLAILIEWDKYCPEDMADAIIAADQEIVEVDK